MPQGRFRLSATPHERLPSEPAAGIPADDPFLGLGPGPEGGRTRTQP